MAPIDKASPAAELKRHIARMKPTICQSKLRLSRRLIRSIKILKERCSKQENSERLERKLQRLAEELKALRTVKKNEASKLALVNTKSLNQLLAEKNCTADQRALYKLITQPAVVASVSEYRDAHPKWQVEVPFTLQRLDLKRRRQEATSTQLKQVAKSGAKASLPLSQETDRQDRFGTGVVCKLNLENVDGDLVLPEPEPTTAPRSESTNSAEEEPPPEEEEEDSEEELDSFFQM